MQLIGGAIVSALLAVVPVRPAKAADVVPQTEGVQPAPAAPADRLTATDLEAWLDGFMPYALEKNDVAGAVVVVVKDGKVLLEKGYGYSDLAKHTPVDPERTLFRPGSVSKLFTWTAVMQLLEQEGFLRTVPRRGVYILRKTKREIVEMIHMWAALESMAARLATQRATDEEIARLRHMFDNFRDATPAEHIDEYSDANIAFHQAIIRLSGSHLMGKTIENLFLHVRAIRRLTISQSDRASRSIVDHMHIIEALEKRDTELAERLVRQHSLDLAAYVDKHCDFLA